jgi:ubiquinone/menaquinone biosynthesis C-methylase UbiE
MAEDTLRIDKIAAEAYERYLVPGIFGPWAEVAVSVASPRPGDAVLDVACGTGIGARIAARHMFLKGQIMGLDLDGGMIAVARSLAAEVSCFIDWYREDALTMPFEQGTFDLCLCLHGLQYFSNRRAGLEEMRRVLKPDGKLVASMWASLEHNYCHLALVQALEKRNIETTSLRQSFSLGGRDEIIDLARQAGFSAVDILTEEKNVLFVSPKLFFDQVAFEGPLIFQTLARIPEAQRSNILEDFKSILNPYIVSGQLLFPMRAHILMARL